MNDCLEQIKLPIHVCILADHKIIKTFFYVGIVHLSKTYLAEVKANNQK